MPDRNPCIYFPQKSQGHHHAGHNHSPSQQNKKKLRFLLFLFIVYMIAEVIGAFLSGSLTLLADAGHMAIDSSSIALGLFAMWISLRPPTPEKSYGWHRAEILAALANAILLIMVAAFIFREAWPRFLSPPQIRGGLMISIATGGLIINLIGLTFTRAGSQSSFNMKGVWLHILADTMGSVSAVIGSVVIWKFGWYLIDPILSCILSLFIVVGAIKLLLECVSVLLEGTPKQVDIKRLREGMINQEGVSEVHDLHVWTLTSEHLALSAHVGINSGVDHALILHGLTDFIRNEHRISHVTLQLEPPEFEHKTPQ